MNDRVDLIAEPLLAQRVADDRGDEIKRLRIELAETQALELNHEGACVRLKSERDAALAKVKRLRAALRRVIGEDDGVRCPEPDCPHCRARALLGEEK